MSKVVLNEVDEMKYQAGDLFTWSDEFSSEAIFCILVHTGEDDNYRLIPLTGRTSFRDSWKWDTCALEHMIIDRKIIRLPKGSSITITQE